MKDPNAGVQALGIIKNLNSKLKLGQDAAPKTVLVLTMELETVSDEDLALLSRYQRMLLLKVDFVPKQGLLQMDGRTHGASNDHEESDEVPNEAHGSGSAAADAGDHAGQADAAPDGGFGL